MNPIMCGVESTRAPSSPRKSIATSVVTTTISSLLAPIGISAIVEFLFCPFGQTARPHEVVAQDDEPGYQKNDSGQDGQNTPNHPQDDQHPAPDMPNVARQSAGKPRQDA